MPKTDAFRMFGMMARISVLVGDITQQKVDAVVNAANRKLTGGSGVNGAIYKANGLFKRLSNVEVEYGDKIRND